MKILVCGGAGYIGSHTCLALLERGHEVVVFDNLSNGSLVAIRRVEELAGAGIQFIQGDVRDAGLLRTALADNVDAVVHFAALKSIGESWSQPLRYFDNNVTGTICLLQAMEATGVNRMVFSSSAAVYGDAASVPVSEASPLQVANPYGRTKLVIEQVIGDFSAAKPEFSAFLLRYFNPVGAHSSGRIGEAPLDSPNNLMPYICQVAIGRRSAVRIFGSDYPTPDGTGVRDYIHVVDLAIAHVRALESLEGGFCIPLNLGAGRGFSVLEVLDAFELASGRTIPREFVARRLGDVSELWADASGAERALGWRAELNLERMCADAWRWQLQNPDGYC